MKGLTAQQVRAKAAQLVQLHAARLGMDQFGAAALVRAIEGIPVDPTPGRSTHRSKDSAGFGMDEPETIEGARDGRP